MFWTPVILVAAACKAVSSISISNSQSGSSYHSESESKSEHSKSSKHHSKQGYSYKVSHSSPHSSFGYSSDFNFPLGYGFKYASDYDGYVSLPLDIDPDLDPDLNDIDFDTDLDFDLSDIELDIDLLKLKYGLYGLNHYTLREPHFNDYRFRKRYRLRHRPYYSLRYRYLPSTWKYDLDFWGLDNYSLGFGYDSFSYDLDSPTSYVHVSRF